MTACSSVRYGGGGGVVDEYGALLVPPTRYNTRGTSEGGREGGEREREREREREGGYMHIEELVS